MNLTARRGDAKFIKLLFILCVLRVSVVKIFMQFVFNLTIREIRSSWRRLLFFFLCIAIGVGSVVALRSLIQNLGQAVGGDARAFLTADIEISSTSDFSPSEISLIEQAISGSKIIEDRNETINTSRDDATDGRSERKSFVYRTKRNCRRFSARRKFCFVEWSAVRH